MGACDGRAAAVMGSPGRGTAAHAAAFPAQAGPAWAVPWTAPLLPTRPAPPPGLPVPSRRGKVRHAFTAHPKVDPETGEMFYFGYDVEKAPYCEPGLICCGWAGLGG